MTASQQHQPQTFTLSALYHNNYVVIRRGGCSNFTASARDRSQLTALVSCTSSAPPSRRKRTHTVTPPDARDIPLRLPYVNTVDGTFVQMYRTPPGLPPVQPARVRRAGRKGTTPSLDSRVELRCYPSIWRRSSGWGVSRVSNAGNGFEEAPKGRRGRWPVGTPPA